jgi:hypothetical protein
MGESVLARSKRRSAGYDGRSAAALTESSDGVMNVPPLFWTSAKGMLFFRA